MVDQIRVYTLGGLTVRNASDRGVKFLSHKVEALLVYLACNRGEYTRARLAELFWGELGEERALANLRLAVFDIQKAMKTLLTVTRQTLQLNAEIECWVDLPELANILALADQEWQTAGVFSFSTAEQLKEAVGLYRGDFLAGFKIQENPEFEQWVVEVQENTRMQVLSMLSLLVRHYTEVGNHTEAYRQARRLLELDPLWEQAYRQIMYLLTRSGQRQKAIAHYKQCCDILQQELAIEPEVATKDLLRRIQAGEIDTVPEPPPPPYHVPAPSEPFVGRELELQQLLRLIDNPTARLVSVLGMGGIGKTRLVLETAQQRRNYFRDGVHFIEALTTPDLTSATIAHAINMPIDTTFSDQELIEHLSRKELLLILDSAEHLAGEANLLHQIVAQTSGVKLLVTSREVLKLPGENTLLLAGMHFPTGDDIDDIQQYDAVRFFVQSAQRVSATFSLEGNEAAVLRICELLEGLPIGIELTASWLRAINCTEIVNYLEESLDLLLSPAEDTSPRSLRAMLARSWDLLTSNEKDALMRLAVFSGGFDFEAAQEGMDVSVFLLENLVTKSLLQFDGQSRYRFHDLIRLYAQEQLTEAGAAEQARKMQLAYYVKMAQQAQEHLAGAEQNQWLKRLDTEIENIRAALSWALEHDQGREAMIIASSISNFWLNAGYLTEGIHWLEQSLAQTTGEMMGERADALARAASVAMLTAADSSIDAWLSEGMSIYRHLGDLQGVASTLRNMANLERRRGNYALASSYFEECISTFQQAIVLYKTMKSDVVARPLNDLGALYLEKGDFSQARELFLESLPLSRKRDDMRNIASTLSNLGATAFGQGNYEEAQKYLEEALALHRELQNRVGIAPALINMAKIAIEKDELQPAQQLAQEALDMARESADKFGELEALWALGDIEFKRQLVTEAKGYYRDSLTVSQSLANQLYVALTLGRFGFLKAAQGDSDKAIALLEFAAHLYAELGITLSASEQAKYAAQIADLRTKTGEAKFDAQWSDAQSITLKDVIKMTLV